MEYVEHTDPKPEPISIARYRELLGEDAESMTDQDIEDIRRHAGDDGVHRRRDVPGAVPHLWVATVPRKRSLPKPANGSRCRSWSAR
jgi:hypothetical protein